jgi:murein DD-endopeptidase MepM/ murein hydrolase activator NlpD
MPDLRSLRLSRGMTLVELAMVAGIPARTLGAIEYGHARLDADSAMRLASSLGVAPELLWEDHTSATLAPSAWPVRWPGLRPAAPLLIAIVISGLLLTHARLWQPLSASSARVAAARPAATTHAPTTPPSIVTATPARQSQIALRPTSGRAALVVPQTSALPTRIAASPTVAATPTPLPTPLFRLEADGPHGCPLVADGSIVITQGYGEGTHAPAATMGALDLAVDGDGDGSDDPAATDGQLVVATHAGVARVFPMSWPGGNFVLLEDTASGWSTAYGHLSSIAVAEGQFVEAGTPLGTVGSTGDASGPHLHYEVRYGGVNLDPAGLIECWG